jgi:hypothetical protein
MEGAMSITDFDVMQDEALFSNTLISVFDHNMTCFPVDDFTE